MQVTWRYKEWPRLCPFFEFSSNLFSAGPCSATHVRVEFATEGQHTAGNVTPLLSLRCGLRHVEACHYLLCSISVLIGTGKVLCFAFKNVSL